MFGAMLSPPYEASGPLRTRERLDGVEKPANENIKHENRLSFRTDQCLFGTPWRKRSGLLAVNLPLACIEKVAGDVCKAARERV